MRRLRRWGEAWAGLGGNVSGDQGRGCWLPQLLAGAWGRALPLVHCPRRRWRQDPHKSSLSTSLRTQAFREEWSLESDELSLNPFFGSTKPCDFGWLIPL